MIAGSFSSIVSRVENRSPQASHSRRRRIVAPSSLTRESMTRVSLCWQKGQCKTQPYTGNCLHCFSTFSRTPAMTRSSFGLSSTSQIQWASATQSGSL